MIEAFEKNLKLKLGDEGFRKVRAAKVGIAGAGGLGSNCAVSLVRSGFRDLVIADFDVIDVTNLDRQAYFSDQVGLKKVEALRTNLLKISSDLAITVYDRKLDSSNILQVFAGCDVIAECFDRAEAKRMFVESLLPTGKFLVAASGLGGVGASDAIRVHRIKEDLIMIGDLGSDIEKAPAIAPRVAVAAAKQADVILEHVLGKEAGPRHES